MLYILSNVYIANQLIRTKSPIQVYRHTLPSAKRQDIIEFMFREIENEYEHFIRASVDQTYLFFSEKLSASYIIKTYYSVFFISN